MTLLDLEADLSLPTQAADLSVQWQTMRLRRLDRFIAEDLVPLHLTRPGL